MSELSPLLAALTRRHGIGPRDGRVPAWMRSRLERSLELIARRSGVRRAVALAQAVESPALLAELADVLRVGETRFYRDPGQWRALSGWLAERAQHQPDWAPRWLSAGCATGEEAWTAALVSRASLGSEASFSVLGFDRSALAVEAARAAQYPPEVLAQLPAELTRWLLQGAEHVQPEPGLRRQVRFAVRDAVAEGPPHGRYDVVLFRNVLIYFADAAGAAVVTRLLHCLRPGGILLVARSEVSRVRSLGHASVSLGEGVQAFGAR